MIRRTCFSHRSPSGPLLLLIVLKVAPDSFIKLAVLVLKSLIAARCILGDVSGVREGYRHKKKGQIDQVSAVLNEVCFGELLRLLLFSREMV